MITMYHVLHAETFSPVFIHFQKLSLTQFLGCSVHGNSDSDTQPLTTVEDISLNTLDGLGSLNSLNNLVPSSLETSPEFLPLALFYKSKAPSLPASRTDQAYQPPPSYPPSSASPSVTTGASEADNIRKSIFFNTNVTQFFETFMSIFIEISSSWSCSFMKVFLPQGK